MGTLQQKYLNKFLSLLFEWEKTDFSCRSIIFMIVIHELSKEKTKLFGSM